MYWIQDIDVKNGIKNFCCTSISDIATLPTTAAEGVEQKNEVSAHEIARRGSSCLCLEDGSYYMLTPDDLWMKIG